MLFAPRTMMSLTAGDRMLARRTFHKHLCVVHENDPRILNDSSWQDWISDKQCQTDNPITRVLAGEDINEVFTRQPPIEAERGAYIHDAEAITRLNLSDFTDIEMDTYRDDIPSFDDLVCRLML